jgi:hypothetical protein
MIQPVLYGWRRKARLISAYEELPLVRPQISKIANSRGGQRAVPLPVRERDPAVDINGLPIHLALPLSERWVKAPIGLKFSWRPLSPCAQARCRRSG